MLATGSGVSLFVSFYLYGSSTAMVIPTLIASVLIVLAQILAPIVSKKYESRTVVAVCGFGLVHGKYLVFGPY